jgi:hypothetical protein
MVLRLCGYDVIAADKAFVLNTLSDNIRAIATTCPTEVTGTAEAREFDWTLALSLSAEELRGVILGEARDRHTDLVVLSDCFYQGDAVHPLLHVLNTVSEVYDPPCCACQAARANHHLFVKTDCLMVMMCCRLVSLER